LGSFQIGSVDATDSPILEGESTEQYAYGTLIYRWDLLHGNSFSKANLL
jgi:hypothetical protein